MNIFGFRKAHEIFNFYAEENLGIDFVDILPARPAGTGKFGPRGATDRPAKKAGVHDVKASGQRFFQLFGLVGFFPGKFAASEVAV